MIDSSKPTFSTMNTTYNVRESAQWYELITVKLNPNRALDHLTTGQGTNNFTIA